MEQLTIFNYNYSEQKKEIINHLESFGIDQIYDEFYNFFEISNIFSKEKNYKKYLNLLSKELSKHIKESKDAYDDFFSKKEYSSFSKEENYLIVYDSIKGSVGPVYCATMLKDTLFEKPIQYINKVLQAREMVCFMDYYL